MPTPVNPVVVPAPPSSATLRSDMRSILLYIQGARIVSTKREVAISRLKYWLVGRMWFGFFVAVAIVAATKIIEAAGWDRGHGPLISAFVLVLLASRSGAIVSIGRRMSDDNLGIGPSEDSIFTIASLGSGKNGLRLALLSANAFGLVVVAIFASGLPSVLGLNGGIAPVFRDAALNAERAKAEADANTADALRERNAFVTAYCSAHPGAVPAVDAGAPTTGTKPGETPKNGGGASAKAGVADRRPDADPPTGRAADGAGSASGPPLAKAGRDAGPGKPGKPGLPTGGQGAPAAGTPSDPSVKTAVRVPDCSADALRALAAAVEVIDGMAKASAADLKTAATLPPTGGSASDLWFVHMTSAMGLQSVPDFFKLLVWAFVAGFFEQIVPDMLDGLAARAKKK